MVSGAAGGQPQMLRRMCQPNSLTGSFVRLAAELVCRAVQWCAGQTTTVLATVLSQLVALRTLHVCHLANVIVRIMPPATSIGMNSLTATNSIATPTSIAVLANGLGPRLCDVGISCGGHLDVVSDVGIRSIGAGTSLLVMEQ